MKRGRKIILLLLTLATLVGAGVLVWKKLTSVNEPILDVRLYPSELDSIRQTRALLKNKNVSVAILKSNFIKAMNTKIFPYWYGTEWDFNGTTQFPQKGKIACGYFVTTTLQQAGVPINRVKMAQCASEEMIRSLTSKKNIHHLSGISLSEFENKLKKLGNGLYIIGLDNHTGYLLIDDKQNYFIHASGWFPFKVVRQKISESDVLARSKYRVVGKISDDDFFLKNWLKGSE